MKEMLDNLTKMYELSKSEHNKILKQLISSLFNSFLPSDNPVAYFIIGQPGVGKTTYINTQDTSNMICINADHYRELHPKAQEILNNYPLHYTTLTNTDSYKFADEIMNYATKHNYSFLRERSPREVKDFLSLVKSIPSHYKIKIDVLAGGNINSILSTRERYELQLSSGVKFAKLTSFDAHDKIYNVLPQILNALCGLNIDLHLICRDENKTLLFNKFAYNFNGPEFVNKLNSLRENDNKNHAKNINIRINKIEQQMIKRSASPEQFENLKIVENYCINAVKQKL